MAYDNWKILAQKFVAVLSFKGQNTKSFEKVCMQTAAISFTQKILSAELVLCSTLHLFDLQILFINMPQEARKGKSRGGRAKAKLFNNKS